MDKGYINENWKSTYERRMEEAEKELYISPSSPEAVILENFTGFTSMQMEKIRGLSAGMEEKLINLAGFYRKKSRNKKIYVETSGVGEGFLIPACQKFKVGSLCFESERSREISGAKLIGVYLRENETIEECSGIIFAKQPVAGTELYFVFDRLPSIDTEISIYLECRKNKIDLLDLNTENKGTRIEWECYTDEGYKRIKCTDDTGNFNKSGSITFDLGLCRKNKTALGFMREEGYIIRGTFINADYNICPLVKSIRGAVFPLIQRDTRSYVYNFAGQGECYVYSDIMEEQYVRVYGRKHGEVLYRKFREEEYERIRQDYGRYCYRFSEEYESIAVAAYLKDAVRGCELGCMYGYDNEEFALPFDNITEDGFSIILEITNLKGEVMYDFVKPKIPGAMGFIYELEEEAGRLKVISAGECAGSRLYIGEMATAQAAEGALLKGTELIPSGYDTGVRFFNVSDTVYGGMKETFGELKRRFVSDVYKSYTAVTEKDYEAIVMGVSEVNVKKVKAVGSPKENKITIAVYIKGMKPGERLSDISKMIIMREINKRRLLSTRVDIVSPVFTAIDVSAVITVKNHYEHCENSIRETIVRLTDYIESGKGFGELLMLEELYGKIQGLSCVSHIKALDMVPVSYGYASVLGNDIKPANNCLLTPGSIQLTLNHEKGL